jgi:fructose-1,6-bisphosphatase I
MAACLLGSLSAALLLPSRAPAPSMVASMPKTAVEKKVLIPVFPEACEYTGITLTRYMNEVARANPELLDLETLIASIQTACKTINMLVERAHITGLVGYADGGGSINVQGEEQKTLDVVTNDVLKKALRFTGKMGVIASEEEDTPVEVGDFSGLPEYDTQALMDETGRYTAVFDPLDGSSNVDAGIPTGTIFGIFEDDQTCIVPEEGCEPEDPEPEDCDVSAVSAQCLAATLQPGTSLVASGYCLYSSSTFFALTLGAGVQIFTLDTQIGEFVLTHPNVKIPERGAIYSMNEANRQMWDQPLRSYIEDIQSGQGESGKAYSSRYIGSMVGDVHRTLLYGGVFGYPADAKNRNGKIRLLYEAAPMAYLVEQAGGLATTGKTRIMDLVPQNVHQRVPVILGSPDDVKECRRYYDAFTASATMDGSDEAKAIRARCFTRLTPGQLVDTTMTKEPDSIALDTTGDGTVDRVVPIEDKDKYMKK